MKIVKNEKLIQRNAKIGRYTSLAGLAILGVGMYITFARPELVMYSWASLFVGFILSQVGIFFGNRWGRRTDEKLEAALKGLDDRWTLVHYALPSEHVLIGPGGLWLLKTYHQAGNLTFDAGKKRWRLSGGGFAQSYMRLFGQDNMGRPEMEIEAEKKAVQNFLKKRAPDTEVPQIKAALVMLNEAALIDDEIEGSAAVAVSAKKLKETIRKQSKEGGISPLKLTQLEQAIGLEA